MSVFIDPKTGLPYKSNNFRRKRFEIFADIVNNVIQKDEVRILDVGGAPQYWDDKFPMMNKKVKITLINLLKYDVKTDIFDSHQGNACDMSMFGDDSFDIVHSNSVIEHVGRWSDMEAMAREVSRIAPAYFVQTPNFWFPMEPHARTPFLHWLPVPLRYKVIMARKCGLWTKADNVMDAMRTVETCDLIDARMLAALFPDGEIRRERFVGLTKSLMAVRRARS
jgi:hypothetical protein